MFVQVEQEVATDSRASAFPCALVGLKEIVYSHIPKVRDHLCILPEACEDTAFFSLNKVISGLWSVTNSNL